LLLRNICVINDHWYVLLVVSTSRSFPHSWRITGFETGATRRVLLVEQELITLPEHLRSPWYLSGFLVTQSLVFCWLICRSLFGLLSFFIWPLCCLSFVGLRILITSLWYLQSRLILYRFMLSFIFMEVQKWKQNNNKQNK
jgi:hypothetical protein